jgi:hypothetical protein
MDAGERGDGVLRRPGSILLISCYELGHQPLSIASAAAFLERAGYTPGTLDISSVESFDVESAVLEGMTAASRAFGSAEAESLRPRPRSSAGGGGVPAPSRSTASSSAESMTTSWWI